MSDAMETKRDISSVTEEEIRKLGKSLGQIFPTRGPVEDTEVLKRKLSEYFEITLSTGHRSDVTVAHRAASCVTLCGLIERCQAYTIPGVADLLWTSQLDVWRRTLSIVLERSTISKAKSTRQMILVLTDSALRCGDSEMRNDIRTYALGAIYPVLLDDVDYHQAKSALQTLAHFITKGFVSLEQLWSSAGDWIARKDDAQIKDKNIRQSVLRRIFDWISYHDTGQAAGNLVQIIFKRIYGSQSNISEREDKTQLPIWIAPLEDSIRAHESEMRKYKDYAFPAVFTSNLQDFHVFLTYMGLEEIIQPGCSSSSLENKTTRDETRTHILFDALQTGKELALICEVDSSRFKTIEVQDSCIILPDILFGRLLAHSSPIVRLSAFSLLASSLSVTRPFTNGTLKYLRRNFAHLFADTDANMRSDLMAVFQHMVDRLRSCTAAIFKLLKTNGSISPQSVQIKSPLGAEDFHDMLQSHVNFTKWLLRFLSLQLRPTASYQHHITALKALIVVAKSGLDPRISNHFYSKQALREINWPFRLEVLSSWAMRCLKDLLMNPFEDVRLAASTLLNMDPDNKNNLFTGDRSPYYLDRATKSMLRSGRADHADGVARAHYLKFKLSTSGAAADGADVAKLMVVMGLVGDLTSVVNTASQSLSNAVGKYPIHGLLSSIRLILDEPDLYTYLQSISYELSLQWKDVYKQLSSTLQAIWHCVRNVLCNDAPEGHVPDEFEEDNTLTTKDILSYSWRALKEASSLIRVIILRAPLETPSSNHGLVYIEDFKSLSSLTFEQLAELRHRGAFSTVAQTFAACCARCYTETEAEISNLPENWYRETLLLIQSKGSSITRRSAGIPSMITGILSAHPEGPLLRQAMQELEMEARSESVNKNISESSLPQVHALNCLRSIFLHSKLGVASERYIGSGLELAASRLESNVWAIRNCGLMLFRALSDRFLGNNDVQDWTSEPSLVRSSRVSYESHGNLLQVLKKLLEPKDREVNLLSSSAVEGVFPALQILQRAPPSIQESESILPMVLLLTSSPHWHLRDMAARTYARLLSPKNYVQAARDIRHTSFKSHNQLHGTLLCLHYIVKTELQRASELGPSFSGLLNIVDQWYLQDFSGKRCCAFTKMTLIGIMNICRLACARHEFPGVSDTVTLSIHRETEEMYLSKRAERKHAQWVQEAGLRKATASLYLFEEYLRRISETSPSLTNRTIQATDSPVRDMKDVLLNHLQALDSDTCCAVLESLNHFLQHVRKSEVGSLRQSIVEGLCIFASTNNRLDPQVQSKALEILFQLAHSDEATVALISLTHLNFPPLYNGNQLSKTWTKSPSLTQNALSLWGLYLDAKVSAAGSWQKEFEIELDDLVHYTTKSLNEYNEYPVRYAAAQCLHGLRHIWQAISGEPTRHLAIKTALAVYDALNDDDNDVRNLAAEILPRILATKASSTRPKTVVPLSASQTLAAHLTWTHSTSRDLCKEAVSRLTNSAIGQAATDRPVSDMLAAAQRENTALFVVEKQNLFVDPVREARVWSRVALNLERSAVPSEVARRLSKWVTEGLNSLKAATEGQFDGALGFASTPDVFALGIRVIYAVEVLFAWRMRGVRIGVRTSRLRIMLFEWVEVGRERGMHEMWIDAVMGVLEKSVSAKLGAMATVMRDVLAETGHCW